ncbi:DUF1990 domain-containing protein [Kitasatospora sp. NPDC085879]|uniref:DUF1990 family protein n=1 Tax=Kitasatospora sp. NPDC085879 TaxID=3154769 RepID=UPI003440946C
MTLTYPEVGATAGPGPLPAGYHHLRHRTAVGRGAADFTFAGSAVTGWRMHRAAGVRITADGPRALPGTRVTCRIGLGPLALTAPCEVVLAVDEPRRAGFAYGTLPGHPECGEESFLVELGGDGTVWFTVTAFSRPGRRLTRLGGPLVPLFQRLYALHCGRTLRRLTARRTAPHR